MLVEEPGAEPVAGVKETANAAGVRINSQVQKEYGGIKKLKRRAKIEVAKDFLEDIKRPRSKEVQSGCAASQRWDERKLRKLLLFSQIKGIPDYGEGYNSRKYDKIMFGQKYRQQAQKPNESSVAADCTAHSSSKFSCYADQTKGITYFVYWNAQTSTLGVSNLAESVYELFLEKKNRKRMLKNVAETFVDAKWKSIFTTRGLKLGNITENSMVVSYICESVHLSKVLDPDVIHLKNVELLKNALDEVKNLTMLLKAASSKEKSSPEAAEYSLKRHEKSIKPVVAQSTPLKLVDLNRRKRAKPTGVVFEDDDNEDQEEHI